MLRGPDLTSPVPKITLGQLYFENCIKFSKNICQIDGTTHEEETYESVKKRSVRAALELKNRGITPEDCVAFCSGNTIDTIIPILGTYFLGAKVANLEPTLTEYQMQHLLFLVKPKIVFVEDQYLETVKKAGVKEKAEYVRYSELKEWCALSNAEEESFKPTVVPTDNIALIFFSSGTTGLPKGICHTHASFVNSAYSILQYNCFSDRVIHISRFYWITASIFLNNAFLKGGCRIFCQNSDLEEIFQAIALHKPSNAFIPSSLVEKFVDFAETSSLKIPSLKRLFYAGNPVKLSLPRTAKILDHCDLVQIYGLSEVSVATIFNLEETRKEFLWRKRQSCGNLLPGFSLKITDPETQDTLGPHQRGEICMKASSNFKEYYSLEPSNVFDSDGFIKTGDVGYYDEDQCLYVVERIKEMFKFKDWHVVPTVLEGILQQHPKVEEAAVFGVPWGSDGEAPGACVVLKENDRVDKEELEEFVNQKVTEKERLRGGIWFVKSLPKTTTGKIQRKLVQKEILNKRSIE